MSTKWIGVSLALAVLVSLQGCSETKITAGVRDVTTPSGNNGVVPVVESGSTPTIPSDIPTFETTPEQLKATTARVIADAEARISTLSARPAKFMTFENTIRAIDELMYPVVTALNRIYLIQNVSQVEVVRDEATNQVVTLEAWLIGVDYRQELFDAVKAFRERNPSLESRTDLTKEDLKYYNELWTGYKRAGMLIEDESVRKNIKAMKEQLALVSTAFDTNIRDAAPMVGFTDEELVGVRKEFVESLPVENGKRMVNANITPDYMVVAQNAKLEETRKKMEYARQSIAQDVNQKVLAEMLELRHKIAVALGYANHADYVIEPKMAKTGEKALTFLKDLKEGLEPKFKAEIETLRALKAEETGVVNPDFNLWDWRYFQNKLMKEKYSVDTEQLRVFFEIGQVTKGVFGIYEELFSLKIEKMEAPQKWVDDLELYVVKDAANNGEVLGYFYLDNFPRPGKYNHFAQFGIVDGRMRSDGTYAKPVVALVCNFPKAEGDKPALMRHADVETFFHEFGHGMHSILTKAHYSSFSGTSVERDFVESPSQTLEAWAWDVDVLNRFAADYRDPNVKVNPELVQSMKAADLATKGAVYRRQLVFGLSDLQLHMGANQNAAEVGRKTFADVFLALPEGADYTAGFGHLSGYDAGYYGYAWADAISQDLLTAFKSAPGGLMDSNVGMKLRREIYEVGGSRDANESVRAFLGREWEIGPFLKSIGIGN